MQLRFGVVLLGDMRIMEVESMGVWGPEGWLFSVLPGLTDKLAEIRGRELDLWVALGMISLSNWI